MKMATKHNICLFLVLQAKFCSIELSHVYLPLSGTNDAFVTIALGKEKYQTSVKEKATDQVDWCEQCEL